VVYRRVFWVIVLWLTAFSLPELLARLFVPAWNPAEENARTVIPDRDVGWLYKPFALTDTARNSGTYVASSLGLRNAELGEKNKARVVFLGDSFTWGWGVPNGVRFTDALERAYPHYQIVNAGINGYSTVQETLLLKKYHQVFQPDLVVLQMFHNDFIENLETGGIYSKPYLDWSHNFELKNYPVKVVGNDAITRSLLWITSHTYFYRQLVVAAYVWWMKNDERMAETPTDEETLTEAMRVALKDLIGFCRENNLPLLVMSSDLQPYQRDLVRQMMEAQGISHYDLTERVFRDQQGFSLADYTGHWNARGHQLVADFIGPILDERLRAD
jgi:lysophospholipase L1-like esterase